MDEIGYLVESGREAFWVGIEGGRFYWTTEADKALRFSREEDTQSFIEFLLNNVSSLEYRGSLRAVGHIWNGSSSFNREVRPDA